MQAKRKADKEMFLTQIEEKRKMEDIRLKGLSEQRTIQEEIEKQQLQNSWTATKPSNFPGHTSTSTRGHTPSFQPSLFNMGSFNSPMMQQTMNASSIWLDTFVTKMRSKPFDGSPKDWPHFIASYESFVHNTALPDHQILLILNDVLSPEVRKRMAHLLQSPNTYEAAINELRSVMETRLHWFAITFKDFSTYQSASPTTTNVVWILVTTTRHRGYYAGVRRSWQAELWYDLGAVVEQVANGHQNKMGKICLQAETKIRQHCRLWCLVGGDDSCGRISTPVFDYFSREESDRSAQRKRTTSTTKSI